MPANLLSAIANITGFHNNDLRKYSSRYLNRVNAVGEQLEFFVKDAAAGCFEKPQKDKEAIYSKVFSWLGNQNNPPDFIIGKGDAFEIKKIESPKSILALNSSPPKNKLHSDDPRILEACMLCEGQNGWKDKDIFYVVGNAKGGIIKYLFFVHGLCYAADRSVYEKVHSKLKAEISETMSSMGLEASETIELGRVAKVDPLGITELRMRGMWEIQNPISVYPGIFGFNASDQFTLVALVEKSKYESFPREDRAKLEKNKAIDIKNVKVKDPNNPAKLIDAKVIKAVW